MVFVIVILVDISIVVVTVTVLVIIVIAIVFFICVNTWTADRLNKKRHDTQKIYK